MEAKKEKILKVIHKLRPSVLLDKLVNARTYLPPLNEADLLELIESGKLRDKVFGGISNKGFEYFNPLTDPSLYVWGGMGGGKTVGTSADLFITKLANFERLMMIVVDISDKEGSDWAFLTKIEDSVLKAAGRDDFSRIFIVFSLLRKELNARAIEFSKIGGAGNYEEYETLYLNKLARLQFILSRAKEGQQLGTLDRVGFEKFLSSHSDRKECIAALKVLNGMKDYDEKKFSSYSEKYYFTSKDDKSFIKFMATNNLFRVDEEYNSSLMELANENKYSEKLTFNKEFVGATRILIVFEEWHKIILNEIMDYINERRTTGTLANMLANFMKTSRSFGVCFTFISQSAGPAEFNSDLEVGIKNLKAYKGSGYGRVLKKDPELIEKFGQFVTSTYEGRSITFPENAKANLIDRYYSPLKTELFGFQFEEWRRILSEKGTIGIIKNFDLEDLIGGHKSFDQFELRYLLERVLKEFGYEIEEVEKNKAKEVSLIVNKNGRRFGVVYSTKNSHYGAPAISKEEIALIGYDLKEKGVEEKIFFGFGKSEAPDGFEVGVSFESLQKIAEIINSKNSIDPELYNKKLEVFALSLSDGAAKTKSRASMRNRNDMGF